MAIAYVTYKELRDALMDSIQSTTQTYDATLQRVAEQASRLADRLTGRTFWPAYATRYPKSDGGAILYIDEGDLLEVSSVTMSGDDGANYTETLTTSDYYSVGGPNLQYDATPIHYLEMNQNTNASYGYWYTGQRAVAVAGTWGWHDDWANAWRNSADTVQDAPLSAVATTLTVTSQDGADLYGFSPRFQVGHLLKVDSEQMLITRISGAELTVIRAQHGTTAAAHTAATAVYTYRAPEVVRFAVIATAIRTFKRAQQAFQDAGGIGDLGQIMYVKELAPEAKVALYDAGLLRVTI